MSKLLLPFAHASSLGRLLGRPSTSIQIAGKMKKPPRKYPLDMTSESKVYRDMEKLQSFRRRPDFRAITGQRKSNTPLRTREYAEFTTDLADMEKPLKESDPRAYMQIRSAHNDTTPSIFRNVTLDRFLRTYMKQGEKEKFSEIVNEMLYEIKCRQYRKWCRAKTPEAKEEIIVDPIHIFTMALQNIRPLLRLINVRRGGTNYQVPAEIPPETAEFKAINWLLEVVDRPSRRLAGRRSYGELLAVEVLDAYNGEGKTMKKKAELYRLCESNRAYAHYRTL